MSVVGTRRRLVLASLVTAFFIATQTMLGLLVPLYAVALGAPTWLVGALFSLGFLLPLFLAMPIGGLVDRVGSRGPLSVATALTALLPLSVWGAPSLVSLSVVQALVGVTHLVVIVSAQRWISDLGRRQQAERNFGIYATFQSAGQLVGPVVAGFLVDVAGYGLAFMSAGALSLVAFVFSRMLDDAAGAPARREGGRVVVRTSFARSPYGERGQVRELLGNVGVRMAIVVSCGVLVAQSVRRSFLPVYLEELQFAATVIGVLFSVSAGMSMVVRPFMAWIVRQFGSRSMAASVMIVFLAVGLGMTAVVETLPPLIVSALLVGLGTGITQPLSIVTVSDHVVHDHVGFALGLRLTGNRLAQVLSPFIVGWIAYFAGLPVAFVVAAGSLLVTLALIARWRREFEQAEARERGEAPATVGSVGEP